MLKQYQRIQVAVDGSKEADVAFSKAVEVAKRNGATLEILHVVDTRAFQDVSSFEDNTSSENPLKKQKPRSKNIIIVLKMPVLRMFIILLNLVLQRILLLMNFLKNTILI